MNPMLLRLIDANANRAREALRVVEDYARFVLDDAQSCLTLKEIRHDLTAALSDMLADAILWRDTPGDVGTANKTAAEFVRQDVCHVVTAAGKRLGEALRAIEEFLKTIKPDDAAKVENVRYRFYDIEQRLAFTLRSSTRFESVRLYVLITEALCKRPWLEAAEAAILGGADCLQLREKELESGEFLKRARQLVELCHRHRALCIVNDRPDIAVLSGADGVHVGQDDLPAVEVRKIVGREKIVGVSTHRVEQARQAVLDGADYLGVGPFFRSPTKPRDFIAGPAYAREAVAAVRVPLVAIAGINQANVDEVLATGIRAVAVTAAVIGQDDPRAAAEALKKRLVNGLSGTDIPVCLSGGTDIPVCLSGGTDIPVCLSDTVQSRRRHLPHWTLAGSTYFVTFRVASGDLTEHERGLVLKHLIAGDGKFYKLLAAVVMPDHAHALLEPIHGYDLSRIMKGSKGVSARIINEHRGTRGVIWQDESWDRIMRDQAELDEKIGYIVNNPLKAELVDDPWQYAALYVKEN